MTIAFTTYAEDTATAVNCAVTTTSRTYNAGELVQLCASFDNDFNAAATISNSGTVQSWTSIANVGQAQGAGRSAGWWCVMSVTQAMTITAQIPGAGTFAGRAVVTVHTGQHATTPVPAGKVVSGIFSTDLTQAITPTSVGSCLWLFLQSNTNAANWAAGANCTIEQTHQNVGGTYALVRPTTQPRTDANSFTLAETDDATSNNMWFAFEVQAAAGVTLSAPTGIPTGPTTATVGATTDDGTGTLYAVVTASSTPPSVAQIKAGQNSGGSTAAWSGNVAVSGAGVKTLNATGLTASSTYYGHLAQTNGSAVDSNVVSSASFTPAQPPRITAPVQSVHF